MRERPKPAGRRGAVRGRRDPGANDAAAFAPRDAEARFAEVLGQLGRWDALCARLDAGHDAALERRAFKAILEIVRGKLAIAKPGHDDYDFAGEQL